MPDTDNKRLAILDELDKFNTAPAVDSLMLGILAEQEAQANRLGGEPEPQPEPAPPSPPEPKPEDEPKQIPNDYLPLNTSIQELNGRIDSRITGLERAIANLSNSFSQPRQQQPQTPAYDPDMPVSMQHVMELANRQEMAYRVAQQAYKHNLSTRAHMELHRFQQQNPDFKMDPAQLDFAIDAMARDNKLDQLEGTNWRGHFEQMYAPQRAQRFDAQAKQIESLQKELETLKKQASKTPAPAQPVSPATGRGSRGPAAISTPLQQSDDAVVNLKSFRQKGNFKGFAKDLPGVISR